MDAAEEPTADYAAAGDHGALDAAAAADDNANAVGAGGLGGKAAARMIRVPGLSLTPPSFDPRLRSSSTNTKHGSRVESASCCGEAGSS